MILRLFIISPALLLLCQCAGKPATSHARTGSSPHAPSSAAARPAAPSPTKNTAPVPASAAWQPVSPVSSQPLASGALYYEFQAHGPDEAAEIEAVVFDSRHFTFKVLDQPSAHAGSWAISPLMRKAGAMAGVNGGFFHPDFSPLGLMIADGRKAGSFTRSNLVSGAVLVSDSGPHLGWNHEIAGEQGMEQMLQAGPRLVNGSQPITSLNRSKTATRTFVATDGGHKWVIGTARSTSLAGLAELLASPGIFPGLQVHRALNLDGGRSTALYVRRADGTEISRTGWSTVRNYLAVVPR